MFCSYGFVFGFNTDLCYIFFEIQIITVSYSTLFGTPFKLLLLTLVQMDYIAFELIPLSQGQQWNWREYMDFFWKKHSASLVTTLCCIN
jgi:hypothetical protein